MDENGIKFQTFSKNKYMYCSSSCLVFKENEEQSQKNSDRKKQWENLYSTLYEDKNFSYNVESSNEVKELLYRVGYKKFTLEVTERCNLRCNYCCFSEKYENQRNHGSQDMKWDTAKKGIDWYFKYYKKARTYNPNLRPVIGFYGGEPLLNINLIKLCVTYSKTLFKKEDDLYFTLTTNGTLLNEEIINFFHDNDINIIISLDGDKISHDRNRVFKDGTGTFDIVMDNINKINEITRSDVFVNSVYDIKTNLKDVFDFFDNHPNIKNINISPVFDSGTDYYKKFTSEDINKFQHTHNNLLKEFLEIVTDINFEDKFNRIPFVVSYFGSNYCSLPLMKDVLSQRRGLIKYTGSCIPGSNIFVDIKGDFHMCEKVPRNWKIGDIKSGLDFKKILEIINCYNFTISNCDKCVIRNNCPTCFAIHSSSGSLNVNDDDCKATISNYKKCLELTYSVLEKNPYWLKTYLDEYYDKLKVGEKKGC